MESCQRLVTVTVPEIFLPIRGGFGKIGHTHVRGRRRASMCCGGLRAAWNVSMERNAKVEGRARGAGESKTEALIVGESKLSPPEPSTFLYRNVLYNISVGSEPQDLNIEDDGLISPEVGGWAETKYRLLALYGELFSTGMKNKWDQRVYIDLYAGAGFSRVKGTRRFLKGSPIIALTVTSPFDKYIFCEESTELLDTLKTRIQRIAPQVQVAYVPGSCDAQINRICAEIPKGTSTHRVLSLCLVDPFDFGIKFETLRRLATVYIDFVVLLAIGMDANRNYEHYVDGNSTKIDEALGNTGWRERWKAVGRRRDFRRFLATEFSLSMKSLDYLEQPLHRMKLVRSDEKNLPLYYLALFSRHPTAYKYWKDVLKYSTDQPELFDT